MEIYISEFSRMGLISLQADKPVGVAAEGTFPEKGPLYYSIVMAIRTHRVYKGTLASLMILIILRT